MRRLVLTCTAFVVVGLISACSRTPEPIEPTGKASTATDASSAPRPSSTLTPPTLPKLAERNDATGAANFVLYWVKVSNYAALTGDTQLLREISAPDCSGCNRYIELYEKTYESGGYIRGAGEHISNVATETGQDETYVRAQVDSPKGLFKPSKSAAAKMTPRETLTVVFASRRSGESWAMTQVGLDR